MDQAADPGIETPYVEIILVNGRGKNPADPGARALVGPLGLIRGTVGGGKVEAKAIREALSMMETKTKTSFHTWNLQKDVGMTCGGEMSLYFELHDPKQWRIAVFGAGHVSQAVVRLLLTLDCHVTCIDPRAEWTNKLPASPKLTVITSETPSREVARFNRNTFFVIMTQGHASDVPILREIFAQFPDAEFVGAIGSEVKAVVMRKELAAQGVSPELIAKLHCPIGLPIGTTTPAEIAVSVVSQLLMKRDRVDFADKRWKSLIPAQA